MRGWLVSMLCAGLLAACGDRKPPEKSVFDPQREAIQKARDTEQKLKQGAEQRQQEIEKSEGAEK